MYVYYLYVCTIAYNKSLAGLGKDLKPFNTPLYPRLLFLSFYNNIANMPYQSKTNRQEHSEATVLLV